ncbi:hypothetical protein PMAYCL1PPCAC_18443, partial [Pristionchus mayeri]
MHLLRALCARNRKGDSSGSNGTTLLRHKVAMDVGDDSTASDSRFDQSVKLLISSDGEMKMSGSDSLHLQILRGVSGQLENLKREIFQNGSRVDSSSGTNTSVGGSSLLEESVDTTDRELQTSSRRTRDHLKLGLARVLACLSFASGHYCCFELK